MVSYTPLFTTLTKKGMTKTELRKNIGFGTNALAKMSIKQRDFDYLVEVLLLLIKKYLKD